jgi:glycosyltransferase involved in cell wall biosynthesis
MPPLPDARGTALADPRLSTRSPVAAARVAADAAVRDRRRGRILLVTNIFPPMIGGPATFIDRLAHTLSQQHGCRVTIVCSSDAPRDPSDVARPFTVHRLCTANKYWYQLKVRLVLAVELLRHRRTLVNGLEEYVTPLARLLRRRYILKIVGDSVWETARNAGETTVDIDAFQTDATARVRFAGARAARAAQLRQANLIVTPSEYLRSMVIGWGVSPDRVVTVANGVEEQPAISVSRRSAGPLKALFVGRLTNWKGVDTALLALAGLDDVELTVAGDGPAYPALVALARQLALDGRVRFLGRQSASDVRRLMASSHVLVLTSLYEGLSHTLIEAASHGLPCIASACGGNPEFVVDGETGLLVQAEDVTALRRALAALAADEPRRHRLAVAAQRRAQQFSITDTTSNIARTIAAK